MRKKNENKSRIFLTTCGPITNVYLSSQSYNVQKLVLSCENVINIIVEWLRQIE